jgi:hypothetical protein
MRESPGPAQTRPMPGANHGGLARVPPVHRRVRTPADRCRRRRPPPRPNIGRPVGRCEPRWLVEAPRVGRSPRRGNCARVIPGRESRGFAASSRSGFGRTPVARRTGHRPGRQRLDRTTRPEGRQPASPGRCGSTRSFPEANRGGSPAAAYRSTMEPASAYFVGPESEPRRLTSPSLSPNRNGSPSDRAPVRLNHRGSPGRYHPR